MGIRRLIMTQGLPGSGKTTWAEKEAVRLGLEQNLKVRIVCKDDIRKTLEATGWKWSQEGEAEVIKLRDAAIRAAFAHGQDMVICADTNFGKHENQLRALAQQCAAVFSIQDFTHVPVETCIERDSKREKPVGSTVIKSMYNKYLAIEEDRPLQYMPDPYAQKAIIVDLDGTVALKGKRSPYDYAKVGEDKLNTPVADIVKLFFASGFAIVYVSGRDAWCRQLTIEWLQKHGLPVPNGVNRLHMRGNTDKRKDSIVKQEIFDTHIRNSFNVHFVLDDRDQVVDMWRSLGLTCLQVAEGNF